MMSATVSVERARNLRKDGLGWNQVATLMGRSVRGLQYQLDDGYAARERDRSRKKRGRSREIVRTYDGIWPKREIGAVRAALAERDARLAREAAVPLSIVAVVMGDPPPGRSALDQRMASGGA